MCRGKTSFMGGHSWALGIHPRFNMVEPCGTMENVTEDSSSTSAVTKITCGSLERGKGKTVAGQWIGLGKITGSYSC